jgi:hypothetical protein
VNLVGFRVGLDVGDGAERVSIELDPEDGDTITVVLSVGDAAQLSLDLYDVLVEVGRLRLAAMAELN